MGLQDVIPVSSPWPLSIRIGGSYDEEFVDHLFDLMWEHSEGLVHYAIRAWWFVIAEWFNAPSE
eukprot:1149159-Pelagomonas_calceolata.AAC.1